MISSEFFPPHQSLILGDGSTMPRSSLKFVRWDVLKLGNTLEDPIFWTSKSKIAHYSDMILEHEKNYLHR